MAASKLSIYRDALRLLADASLTLITDDVDSRYALDEAWDESVAFVLRHAGWRFALKTAELGATIGPLPGFSTAFNKPADWLRTHALYVLAGTLERPVDIREEGLKFSANTAIVYIKYISNSFLNPELVSNPWPEHFSRAVAAYLAFQIAERVTGERSAPGRMSQVFSQHLEEAELRDALPESPWLQFQLEGAFIRVARSMIDEGFWRFAMPPATLQTTSTGTPGAGFSGSVALPTDWSQTRALYVLTPDGRKMPFDVRERNGRWYTSITSFYAEYVSATLANDATKWSDQYLRAVLLQLQFEASEPSSKESQGSSGAAWKDALHGALEDEADPPDPWLGYQLSGEFDRARRAVVSKGFWWWALKEVPYSSQADQLATEPAAVAPYRLALPADWLRTHALFVAFDGTEQPINIRESANDWSTDAEAFTARYLSTAALDATAWPEVLAQAVLAYLGMEAGPNEGADAQTRAASASIGAKAYQAFLEEALSLYSRPVDPWLRFQLNGSYFQAVKQTLERGRWRFAMRTADLAQSSDPLPAEGSDGTVSSGYAYRYIFPNDHLRTVQVYRTWGTPPYADRQEIDFRDEEGAIHADYTPVTIRYLSRMGLDSTKWPAMFRDAVLALLQYQEARDNPASAGVAKAKLEFWEDQIKAAETSDDRREKPLITNVGRVVRARLGGSGSEYGRQQGWYW